MKPAWFRCIVHGCTWKVKSGYYDQYECSQELVKHTKKMHSTKNNQTGHKS